MKSKYIKGTNKKYSIREDGVIISHYEFYGNQYSSGITTKEKELHPSHGIVTTVKYLFNPKNLLLEYFNIRICNQCNTNFKPINNKVHRCNKCKSNNRKISRKKWEQDNIKLRLELNKKYRQYAIYNLTDAYISKLFNTSIKILSQEIIITKRQQLLLHRQLKKK